MEKAYKYHIYPNKKQKEIIAKTFGCCRFVYNTYLAKRIENFSAKYAIGGQMGVVINKVENNNLESLYNLLNKYDLEILGAIPIDKNIEQLTRTSKLTENAIKEFFFRLNLPQ